MERQTREEKWDGVQKRVREVQREAPPMVRDAYEIDPAILLGHFVLTGWGPREAARETHRRIREQSPEPQPSVSPTIEPVRETRESQKFQSLSNAAAAAAVVMMLFSRLQHRVMLPLSLLLSVVAIVALFHSLQLRSRANNHGLDLIYGTCRIMAVAFGLLTVQSALFGVLYGAWSMLGLALLLAIDVTQRTSGFAAYAHPAGSGAAVVFRRSATCGKINRRSEGV